MKVVVLVKASKDSEAGKMPSELLLREMGNFNEELVKAGVMLAGEGLHPSSKGKRMVFEGAGRSFFDGPFAETKELVAGFWIWQVKSMAEAVEVGSPHPEPRSRGWRNRAPSGFQRRRLRRRARSRNSRTSGTPSRADRGRQGPLVGQGGGIVMSAFGSGAFA